MVFWLVNVQFFWYTRAQIDTPAGLEAHYARNNIKRNRGREGGDTFSEPFIDWGGTGMSQICPRFGMGRHENSPSRGLIWPTPWWNESNSVQACRPCRGLCSPIPGRVCFSDLPGDRTVVSPPPPNRWNTLPRGSVTAAGDYEWFIIHH